jgi:methylthioribose-1-phosphate isomerase
LIDQTLLPGAFREITCSDVETMWEAIRMLRVRGAPAIGIAAAFAVVLGLRRKEEADPRQAALLLEEVARYVETARPTAVNLFWAVGRLRRAAVGRALPLGRLRERLLKEALKILEEDKRVCRALGRHGAELLRSGDTVLTHCNAGGLATADYGTALGVIFAAHEAGKKVAVIADETRPLLQGARLTAWELQRAGIEVTLICDSMAAQVMREGRVKCVVVGADRIAANGDTANKIGTYGVAVLAQAHGIPFYVAAPASTFDVALSDGSRIPIEQRKTEEVTEGFGKRTAPEGVKVYNPAFDVTPHGYVAAFITERGILRPPFDETIRALCAAPEETVAG